MATKPLEFRSDFLGIALLPSERETIKKAAKAEGARFESRWSRETLLEKAKQVLERRS